MSDNVWPSPDRGDLNLTPPLSRITTIHRITKNLDLLPRYRIKIVLVNSHNDEPHADGMDLHTIEPSTWD
jgi:hypothetical protein